jgi:membrane-associated phospholipid phosphatase
MEKVSSAPIEATGGWVGRLRAVLDAWPPRRLGLVSSGATHVPGWWPAHPVWVVPVLLLLVGTWWTNVAGGDLDGSRSFFVARGHDIQTRWPANTDARIQALYTLGPAPGILLGVAGVVGLLAGSISPAWAEVRKASLLYVLCFFVGVGMFVQLFKKGWGRPRPDSVVQFGGDRAYRPIWSPGPDKQTSFPSGHAATGFVLLAPMFVWWRRRPWRAIGALAVGLAVGGCVGLGRVMQGRHFPSDILWALGFVYLSGCCFYWLVGLHRDDETEAEPGGVVRVLRIDGPQKVGARAGTERVLAG